MGTCTETGLSTSWSYKKGCRCSCCREWKKQRAKAEQVSAAERSRVWRKLNVDKSRANAIKYQKDNPEKVLEWKLRKYGLSLEQHQALLNRSGGKCMICLTGENGMAQGKRLHIDHDHLTGRVRGLLCGNCNAALGLLQDNTDLLQKAKDYLNDVY